jgi:hypothetical protein
MCLQDVSIGPVEPGEQDQVQPGSHAVQRLAVVGVDFEHSLRRSLERLVRCIADVAKG